MDEVRQAMAHHLAESRRALRAVEDLLISSSDSSGQVLDAEMCAVTAYEAARAAQAHVNALVAEVMQHVFTLGVNPDVLGFHFDNGGRDDKA
jgi:hypothetical protein